MKKLIRASLLVLALSCTAYAGDMPFPVASNGEMPTPVANSQTNTQGQSTTESILTEVVLTLADGVLSLF